MRETQTESCREENSMWERVLIGVVAGVVVTPLLKPVLRTGIKGAIIVTQQGRKIAYDVRDGLQDLTAEAAVELVGQPAPAIGNTPAAN